MPLAPKARAGRRWRHGYYTVLAVNGRAAGQRVGGRRWGGCDGLRGAGRRGDDRVDGGVGSNDGWRERGVDTAVGSPVPPPPPPSPPATAAAAASSSRFSHYRQEPPRHRQARQYNRQR